MTLNERILNDIDTAVNEIFYKYQTELNITSGDIEPLQQYALDEHQKKLSEIIMDVLQFELMIKQEQEIE